MPYSRPMLAGAWLDVTDSDETPENTRAHTAGATIASAELDQARHDLSQMAYAVSHDLQEPLRLISNYAQLLSTRYSGQLDERADKYINYITSSAQRMQSMLRDLLTYSRINTRGAQPARVDTELVLNRALEGLAHRVRDTQAVVDRGELPHVWGDPHQLDLLFNALVDNSLKFRGESSPRLSFRAQRLENLWRFTVADNGMGLDMRFSSRIFEIFQRLNELDRYDGNGMGLAIARRIVERHGGRIHVEAAPGEGAVFSFTLPATSAGNA